MAALKARRLRLLAAAAVALALAAIGGTLASQALAGRTAKPFASVLSPRRGQRVTARPIVIKLQLTGVRLVGATLNGRGVLSEFVRAGANSPCTPVGSARGTICALTASPNDGLRFGANVLSVRLMKGGTPRVQMIRFRVAGPRPLAAAGRDRTVELEKRIRLSGQASLLAPALRRRLARRGRRANLRYRWRIVRMPQSGVSVGADDGPGKRDPYWNVSGEMAGARTATPSLELDRPGSYKVRLTVTQPDGRASADDVTLRVALGGRQDVRMDPPPAVPIDTMAVRNGEHGILVGTTFYPAKPSAWLQVLALDRTTLSSDSGSNKSYECPGASYGHLGDCPKRVSDDLKSYGDNALVIVAAQPGGNGPAPYGAASGTLDRIAIARSDFPAEAAHKTDLQRGTFSGIGVPTGSRSQAVVNSSDDNVTGGGQITGYLVRNNAGANNSGNYTYGSADQAVEFNTQAPGSDADTNVIQVGTQTFIRHYPVNFNWLQIVVVDRKTLKGTSELIGTTGGRNPDRAYVRRLRDTLREANAKGDKLVFLAARGAPLVATRSASAPRDQEMREIADAIESLGGTRTATFKAMDQPGGAHPFYTLVGASHLGPGNGVERLAGNDDQKHFHPLSAAPLSGTLARTGHNYEFELQGEQTPPARDQGGNPTRGADALTRVAFQPPSAWPERDPVLTPDPATRARETAAVAYIGDKVLGTDIRSQYYTLIYKASQWDDIATRIGTLPDTALPSSFGGADLQWAKHELQIEIGWLKSIHTYTSDLSTPFAEHQLESWAQLKEISNRIKDQVGVSGDQKVHLELRAAFQLINGIAGELGHVGEAVGAANQIYETIMKFVEIEGAPAEDDQFQPRADQLGLYLARRLTAAQDALNHQLPNVIASDYRKLKTAGSCASVFKDDWVNCPPPYDPADWRFTQNDQPQAAAALLAQLQTMFYGTLLPAKYTLYRLPEWWRTKVNGYKDGKSYNSDFYGHTFVGIWVPFDTEPASGQYAKPIYRNPPGYSHQLQPRDGPFGSYWTNVGDTWQIFALGFTTGAGFATDPWIMHRPEPAVTNPLFNLPDRAHPDNLGVDPEWFFDRYFKPIPLDHYPERDAITGWCVGFAGQRPDKNGPNCHG